MTLCVCLWAPQYVVTLHLEQKGNSQRKLSPMPFVTKSSASGELNYSALLLYVALWKTSSHAVQSKVEEKKNRRRATFHMISSSFAISLLNSFSNTTLGRGNKIHRAANVSVETLPLSSPQRWECMLLFNKAQTRLLTHKQRRWCIIHFGVVVPLTQRDKACLTHNHSHLMKNSPTISVSGKFKDKETVLPLASCTVQGWETWFNLQHSRGTPKQWPRRTKATLFLCL